jgi:ABC-type transport system involved in cytochrome bd biosynthesis fused ATPase/permease subunit
MTGAKNRGKKMIPSIAIIISAYALARLIGVILDYQHHTAKVLRQLVAIIAAAIIVWQCLEIIQAGSRIAATSPSTMSTLMAPPGANRGTSFSAQLKKLQAIQAELRRIEAQKKRLDALQKRLNGGQ